MPRDLEQELLKHFIALNLNVVVADLNEEAGNSFVSRLNSVKRSSTELFLSKQMFLILYR